MSCEPLGGVGAFDRGGTGSGFRDTVCMICEYPRWHGDPGEGPSQGCLHRTGSPVAWGTVR